MQAQLIRYLRGEVAISEDLIEQTLKDKKRNLSELLLVMWQNGSLTLNQIEIIYAWLESKNLEQKSLN
jgi:hypothetical protein